MKSIIIATDAQIASAVGALLDAAKSIDGRAARKLTATLASDRKVIHDSLIAIGATDVPLILKRGFGVASPGASGGGSPPADVTAPTIPLAIVVTPTSGSNTSLDISLDTVMDVAGAAVWSGLDKIELRMDGALIHTFTGLNVGLNQVSAGATAIGGASGSAATQAGANYTLSSAGQESYSTADSLTIDPVLMSGGFVVTWKVPAFTSTQGYSKMGYMARQSLAAGSKYVAGWSFPLSQANGLNQEYRLTLNGACGQANRVAGINVAHWRRAIRIGDVFYDQYSLDGNNFITVGSVTCPMLDPIYLCRAVLRGDTSGTVVTGNFDQWCVSNQGRLSYTKTGLTASSTHSFDARAFDLAGNPSTYGGAVSGTCSSPAVSGFRDWPQMSIPYIIANLDYTLNDATNRAICARKDGVIVQWQTADNSTQRNIWYNAFTAALAINSALKIIYYTIAEGDKTGAGATSWLYNLVNGGSGNDNWNLKGSGGGKLTSAYGPGTIRQYNIADALAGVNGSSQTFATAAWAALRTMLTNTYGGASSSLLTKIAGFFYDGGYQMAPPWYNDSGSAQVGADYDQNGTEDDSRENATNANPALEGGSTMLRRGMVQRRQKMEAEFPGFAIASNGGSDGEDYRQGFAPLPISANQYYQQWEMRVMEFPERNLGVVISETIGVSSGSYHIANYGVSLDRYLRYLAIMQQFLKLDAQCAFGRACVITSSEGRALPHNADDFEFHRLYWGIAMLNNRVASGPKINDSHSGAVELDEELFSLGAPLATRSMGNLSDADSTFTLRSADYTNGSATFHWAEFQNAIVILRSDASGLGASAAWPSGSAVTCALPNPGVGKKWQYWNAASYTNPNKSISTIGQDTSVNSGVDASGGTYGLVSMKQLTVRTLRRV